MFFLFGGGKREEEEWTIGIRIINKTFSGLGGQIVG